MHLAKQDYESAGQDITHCGSLINDANDPALYAIQRWAGKYLKREPYVEAKLLALQNAQLVQRFPESLQNLEEWEKHPFRQLASIYMALGNRL